MFNAMFTQSRAFSVLAFPMLAALGSTVACQAPVDDDDATMSDEAELRAIRTEEIVGTLTYGETSAPVVYASKPLYRAFSFEAEAGDDVSAWVRSADGDARAWIVNKSFYNVVSNDNADAKTLDAHLRATIKTSGTYYVVFRDRLQEDATFTVSLEKLNAEPSIDPFDPSSCTGTGLSNKSAIALFAPGTTSKTLAKLSVHVRSRPCSTVTGCGAWVDESTANLKRAIRVHSNLNGHSLNFEDERLDGNLTLRTTDGGLRLDIGSRAVCQGLPNLSCITESGTNDYKYLSDFWLVKPGLQASGLALEQVVLTPSCFRARVTLKSTTMLNTSYREGDLVFSARF